MKTKYFLIAQAVFFLGAVVMGLLLKNDLADGPRLLHRIFGISAGVVGLVAAVMLLKQAVPNLQKILAWLVFVVGGVAGYAGNSLKTTNDYSQSYNLMRASGLVALIGACLLLTLYVKSQNKISSSNKEELKA